MTRNKKRIHEAFDLAAEKIHIESHHARCDCGYELAQDVGSVPVQPPLRMTMDMLLGF